MSTNEQTPLSQPTSAVRNTLGREQAPQNLVRPVSDEDLREYCDKNFHQILPIIAEKPHQKKAQQEKLKAVKAVLTSKKPRNTPSQKPRTKEETSRKGWDPGMPEPGPEARNRGAEKNVSARSRGSERKSYYSSRRDTERCYQSSRSKETEIASEKHHYKREYSRRTEAVSESEGSAGGHWKSKPKKQKSSMEDDLSQPWGTEEVVSILETGSRTKAKLQKGKLLERTKDGKKTGHIHPLTKTPREILALDKGKFKPPPPMTTPVEKRNTIKFCEFHGEKRSGKDSKERETSGKDKPPIILMVPPWQKIARQRITQTFSPESVISFPTLGEEDRTESTMIIEAKIGGHCMHRIYVDGGSFLKILYEHYFSKFRPEIKNQLIPVNIPLVGFSREIIWPLGQISLLVRVGDEEHSTSARMNFMVVRSPSPYNGIIGRPGVRKIRAIPSTAHEMIKFPVAGEIFTLQSSMIIPLECSMVKSGVPRSAINQVREEKSRQKKRGQAPGRNKAISEEVKKLVEADIMKEDLNKACSKDGYPLPEIDWKVESLCGYPYKCFLDAYKGYHQIKIVEEDEEKTAFITSQGIFCYLKMPFGLKNARATYQRLVDKAFQKQIGQNLEVYVDDLAIKSQTKKEVIRDIEETFKTLRKINMKLNPKKCTFGMRDDTFLGYKVDADGLRVSPDKVKAVLDLPGKILPFFKTLKKCTKKSDQWTPKAEGAFKEMKQSIAELPMLTAPKEKEELIIYLAAAKEAISAVLMTERDGKQVPIYFVSRALQGPKINYTPMEKLILALYRPKTSVKGQILADFIAERPKDGAPDTPMEVREELSDPWILFTDGSSCVDDSGAGLIIMNPEGMEFTYAQRGENKKADALSKIASSSFAHLSKQVLVEELGEKAIDEKKILAVVEEEGHTWMTPVYEYLTEEVLPEEKKKASTVRRKAGRYAVINEVLYKKFFLGPWLWCVRPLQANYVLREIHEGSCSMHAGPRSVVAKALRLGYFWPTMHTYARNLIRECKDCQVHRPVPRNPQEKLTPITSPWPFYKWGIDIAGPFQEGHGKVKFLIVAIDYFTKWIEARPVATITGTQVKKFVWDNIVCRFGLPGEIISDNGKQFRDNPIKDWCEKLNIRQCFTSVKHPQANGLIERANRSL
uniref:Reverse transcriptase domain-containing protein n=1 Tax=Tanacetum cinerariifolium TaxID=118510 RepID=A0A699GPS9_TANCI|nr:reverse transcriptase domain-containing protein [Tanacetum cinerariifolium]